MSIRNRKGKWHYRFEVDGHEYSKNTGLDATERNKNAAMRKEAKARELVEAGEAHLLRVQSIRFGDAMAMFLEWVEGEHRDKPNTIRSYKGSATSIAEFFGQRPVHAITPGHVEDFKSWRRKEHEIEPTTLAMNLTTLSKFFGYAKSHNWCARNPVSEVKYPSTKDSGRDNILSPEREALYFNAILARIASTKKPWKFQAMYDLHRLVILQGMRPDSEGLYATWDWVDLKQGLYTIPMAKTKAGKRVLKLTAESVEILSRRHQQRQDERPWIFPARWPLNKPRAGLLALHNAALDDIPHVERFVPYDLRHTFASRLALKGCPLPVLIKILGHADLKTVMRYVHTTSEDAHKAMLLYGEGKLEERSGLGPADAGHEKVRPGWLT